MIRSNVVEKRRYEPIVRFDHASVRFGAHELWQDLSFALQPGEFLAVLGPNGSGKTTLLKVLLGRQDVSAGAVDVCGSSPHRGSSRVGYIPQQRAFDRDAPMRGRDLVQFGLNGHRLGLPISGRSVVRKVDAAIASVGATAYANAPIGVLSGGEQQRLRIAQSLLSNPELLLCDEPLLSLDIAHQKAVTRLINDRRKTANTAIIFVTHEINPILEYVDRVLYLVGRRWAIGTPSEVLTSERLSDLYGIAVDVLTVRGRVLVVSAEDSLPTEPTEHGVHAHEAPRRHHS